MRAHSSLRLAPCVEPLPSFWPHRGIALGAFVWFGKRGSPTRRPLLSRNAGTAEPVRVSPPEAVAYPLELFKKAMGLLGQVIEQTGDLTLLTDGERRYGSLWFELCSEALRTGKRGRPKKTLPKGVKVRLKNKGSQRHKRDPKRPKYQAPYPEHPDTEQLIATKDIHANHLEAFNTSLRRRCAAYRRRTNMYAKKTGRLQER